ncbi:acyl-CoA dehydrogenase domain protein [Gordonia bronchialis DSM 43247]|uniref:Acyl-CoA dehydrogenase domain protein n=1 Tax=Gordonia bronchialis (strain ATCC 25592 / DSM 43247 / BCRC 13721 / JCM 3198 / KCTC 3076 / NBRC 16047 / NCTC 10667) TaxID=526226 RepID=D0L4T4_GORB4|nr:acyl-CoA dehydrogenase domain protein [Gordonia bronchialis DSM 43247]QGS25812.1 acyl-CoA dehydrogenase [Gordonia bronchialis]UAK37789.1 acyl-CoA/acyl-ACP dehydrogenase [Gordonia bronchialis]STQ63191.1 crotonobetainyl-CoA dehydrogenase [Gordonia bronchialis]
MSSTSPALGDLDCSTAVTAAAENAADVDTKARFPVEAVNAMRDAGLLSASLPSSLGGRDAGIAELARVARQLGFACSSAAMVFAMHHTQALSLRFHADRGQIADVTRRIAESEALLASSTTEITTGGDTGSSTCAVVSDGDEIVLEKNAPVISYGAEADYICTTARRTPDSRPSDQVLVVCPSGDTELTQTSEWNTLGFRGTCSPGFVLKTKTSARHVVPVPYSSISAHTMLPASHILWASAWLGLADAAIAKTRGQVRAAARKSVGITTPQATKFADLLVIHQRMESSVDAEIRRYTEFLASDEEEPTIAFAIAMNNLKLSASIAVVDVVAGALAICGINGYREDHAASMGRLLRDSYGPQVMVSNDRIRASNAQLVLAYRGQS